MYLTKSPSETSGNFNYWSDQTPRTYGQKANILLNFNSFPQICRFDHSSFDIFKFNIKGYLGMEKQTKRQLGNIPINILPHLIVKERVGPDRRFRFLSPSSIWSINSDVQVLLTERISNTSSRWQCGFSSHTLQEHQNTASAAVLFTILWENEQN